MRRTIEAARQFGKGKSRANRFGGRLCNHCEHQTSAWKMRLHVMECWGEVGGTLQKISPLARTTRN